MNNPLFGITLSLVVYIFFSKLQKMTKSDVLNPLLFSGIAIIFILGIFEIDFETYNEGGKMVSMLIAPATVSLAIPLYNNINLIKKNLKVIVVSITTAVIVHALMLLALIVILKMDDQIAFSLIPKSITTAIASDVSSNIGGIKKITVASVIITGIIGAAASPLLNKLFKIKDDKAIGLALGTSAHAVGTAKAASTNEVQGSFSSLGLILTGLTTVLIAPFIVIIVASL